MSISVVFYTEANTENVDRLLVTVKNRDGRLKTEERRKNKEQ